MPRSSPKTTDSDQGPAATEVAGGTIGYTVETPGVQPDSGALEADEELGPLLEPGSADGAQRYRIRELLGTGGMGEVRLCRDASIGRDIAIKSLRGSRQERERRQRRFLHEARVQAQLEHPAIVPVYELGKGADGQLFFTMRRIRGQTLREVLDALARGDEATCAAYSRRKLLAAFVQICLAVDYAHSRGVLHRDLKPDNIMLGPFGEVYVLDWGVARLVAGQATDAPVIVANHEDVEQGYVAGTPGYMPPEQLRRGGDEQDARTDVYALGCILFEILALEPRHRGRSVEEIQAATLEDAGVRVSSRAPGVPPELDDACAKACSWDKAQRHASPRALALAVEHYLDGDRDVERRRHLSAGHVQKAESALEQMNGPGESDESAAGARAHAAREVTTALALDPENTDARRLLVRLFVEAPERVPPEVQEDMRARDARGHSKLASYGLPALIGWMLELPLLLWPGVRAWAPVSLLIGIAIVTTLYAAWFRWRGRSSPAQLVMVFVGAIAGFAVTSCWLGPFVAIPQNVSISAMWVLLALRQRRERGMVLAAAVLAVALPFLVEMLGVFPPAYEVRADAVTLYARAAWFSPQATIAFLLYSSVLGVIAPAILSWNVQDALGKAERQLFLQAWHLKKLVSEPPLRT